MNASAAIPVQDAPPWRNEVVLCGRLSAAPEAVELPSGDPLWRFRVSVERPRGVRSAATSGRRTVDAVDCTTSLIRVLRRLERLTVGDVVEVGGVLTRRFWRSPAGPASRYEVVVTDVRAGRQIGA